MGKVSNNLERSTRIDDQIVEYQEFKVGELPVLLFEKTEGMAACFEVELSGISRRREHISNAKRQLFSAEQAVSNIWWEIESGNSLSLVHRISDGHFKCSIQGTIQATSQESALVAADKLWSQLRIGLAMGESVTYQFQPSAEPLTGAVQGWSARICPQQLTIPVTGQPVGFTAEIASRNKLTHLSFPVDRKILHFDTLTRLAVHCSEPLTLMVQIDPVTLEPDQLSSLAAIQSVIDQHGLSVLRGQKGICAIEGPELTRVLVQEINQWQLRRRGVRFECLIMASTPVADSLLHRIGCDLFGVNSFIIETCTESLPDEPAAGSIDLTNCVPLGGRFPPFLPSADAMLACGLESIPSSAASRLADYGNQVGTVGIGESQRKVYIAPEDRDRHCYIIGATGTGKSTLVYNLIREDLGAGAGLCVIDPHGDLYYQVLDSVSPLAGFGSSA